MLMESVLLMWPRVCNSVSVSAPCDLSQHLRCQEGLDPRRGVSRSGGEGHNLMQSSQSNAVCLI
jgi:hypothetical protein